MEPVNKQQNFWTKSPEVEKRSFVCALERTKQDTRHSLSPNRMYRMPAGFTQRISLPLF